MALYVLASLAQNAEAVFNVQVKVRKEQTYKTSAALELGTQNTEQCAMHTRHTRQVHSMRVCACACVCVQNFIESIWYPLRDPKVNVREAAVMALKVCDRLLYTQPRLCLCHGMLAVLLTWSTLLT